MLRMILRTFPVALALVGCEAGGGPLFVTEQQEIAVGAETHAQLMETGELGTLYDDPTVTSTSRASGRSSFSRARAATCSTGSSSSTPRRSTRSRCRAATST